MTSAKARKEGYEGAREEEMKLSARFTSQSGENMGK